MVGLTMRNNLVEDTQGRAGGLWCDLDCRDAVFVYNTIRNNPGGPAIFYEVSDHGIIAANVLSGSTYGISVSSANTKIFNNTLTDNVQGINVYDDRRSRGVDGWDDVGPDTRNVEVVNNVISGKNYSLMASSSSVNALAPNTGGNEVLSQVDHNVIHQSNGRAPVFTYWRTLSGHVTLYRRQSSLTTQHGFEKHGRWLKGSKDPLFVDKLHGDLRMRYPVVDAAPLPLDVATALATDPAAKPERRCVRPEPVSSYSNAAARAPGICCNISRARAATLCSHSTSYLVATVWVTEVKSRLPRLIA